MDLPIQSKLQEAYDKNIHDKTFMGKYYDDFQSKVTPLLCCWILVCF